MPASNQSEVENNIRFANKDAIIIKAESKITVDNIDIIKDKRVLVVEDGPTLTHGEMKLGAGTIAARRFGAKELVDPRPYAVGELIETLDTYTHIEALLPAMGYGKQQLKDLEETINKTDCDSVIIGTPIDLSRVIYINKPYTRVHYGLEEVGDLNLNMIMNDFIKKHGFKK